MIRERFGDLVFVVEIRTNIRLAEAPERGETIFEFDPKSTGARAYKLLAAEVLMRARTAAGVDEEAPEDDADAGSMVASLDALRAQLL